MHIHATMVDFFVNVPAEKADAEERRIENALRDVNLVDVTLECERNGHGRAIFKIRVVGPYAGEVLRIIEALES